MRLIAVSRIRNEQDIVEAFLRHHARLVDRHILLDNGCSDGTPDILRRLKQEGLPITLFRGEAVSFAEEMQNTFLLRQATALGADWVLHLDCDEFVDTRQLGVPLRAHLAAVPEAAPCLLVATTRYQVSAGDDARETVVPRRIRRRFPGATGVGKVFVRARVAASGGTVDAGNHGITLGGKPVVPHCDEHLRIAHYPMRSGWQMLAKAATGRLKVLAAGRAELEQNRSSHYVELFENLRDHPEWLLGNGEFLDALLPADAAAALVEDPIDYLGGALRHTTLPDPRLHAVSSIAAYVEALATRHGRLLDESPEARRLSAEWNDRFEQEL